MWSQKYHNWWTERTRTKINQWKDIQQDYASNHQRSGNDNNYNPELDIPDKVPITAINAEEEIMSEEEIMDVIVYE